MAFVLFLLHCTVLYFLLLGDKRASEASIEYRANLHDYYRRIEEIVLKRGRSASLGFVFFLVLLLLDSFSYEVNSMITKQ